MTLPMERIGAPRNPALAKEELRNKIQDLLNARDQEQVAEWGRRNDYYYGDPIHHLKRDMQELFPDRFSRPAREVDGLADDVDGVWQETNTFSDERRGSVGKHDIEYLYDNIVCPIIDNQAMLYHRQPIRRLVREDGSYLAKDDKQMALLAKMNKHLKTDQVMKVINRLTKLYKGGVVGYVRFDQYTLFTDLPGREGQIFLDVVPPQGVLVESSQRSPLDIQQPDCSVYLRGVIPDNMEVAADPSRWIVWDGQDDHYETTVKGELAFRAENPYRFQGQGIKPLYMFHDGLKMSTLWPAGDNDLARVQGWCNVALTSLANNLRYQGWSYPVLTGTDVEQIKTFGVGINRPLCLESGTFSFESPAQNHEAMLRTILMILRFYCRSRRLDPEMFAIENNVMTGKSRLVMNAPLSEIRQEDIPVWQEHERKFFWVCRAVWNRVVPAEYRIDESLELDVTYRTVYRQTDPQEDAQVAKTEQEMGLTNPVDLLIQRNPGMTEDQATEALKRNKRLTALYGRQASPTMSAITERMNAEPTE